jgi:hypothetical protein
MFDHEVYCYITVYHSEVILYQSILITNLYNGHYIVSKKSWLQFIVLLKLAMGSRRRMPTFRG